MGPSNFSEDTLGFRLSMEKSTAIIIADEVRNRAALQFTNPGELLGLVMAHEIGHLLLRSKAHSAEGIMQSKISTNLRDRRQTLLVFTRKQVASMQAEVRRRMGVAIAGKH
jgi:predicted Zn-dependent protease